mmetsp:Transcript_57415/g.105601  ORF Transcript_57415/g.105601 Transcript_57415/m.105601 type:complete len:262 (-) Transcript_57415:345-1130(-)
MERFMQSLVSILCMLCCWASLDETVLLQHSSSLVRHRFDPNGVFMTREVPTDFDEWELEEHAPLVNDSDDGLNSKVYLVAGTPDGGPFANMYFDTNFSRSAMCSVRNMHEEVGTRQCMHWQVEDDYDADWYHVCFDPYDAWVDSYKASLLTVNKSETAHSAIEHKAAGKATEIRAVHEIPFIAKLWSDYCEGKPMMLNMLDLPDSKGLEVIYQSPNLPDACLEACREKAKELGLEDWDLQRCNIDRNRKLEDFPWPHASSN